MAKKATGRQPGADRILDAALGLAAERRWRDVTMEMIADAASTTLQRVYELFPSKSAFVVALMRRTNEKMLAGHDPADAGEPVRERILDVLMRRFEILEPHKPALASILHDIGADPCSVLCSLPAFGKAMAWSLEAAGVSASGPLGAIRIKGLGLIYLSAMRIWFRDDSQDQSRTMAHIDKNLRRVEGVLSGFPGKRRQAGTA